jgi:predicted ABC-type transport system involved in lysophospholipase L1 biosynthesis ATPase subunit
MSSIDDDKRTLRGWWFSVIFMGLVVGLIVFLAYVDIVKENRDILIGIIGMLTGSISSMLAVASGRDPAEVEQLKDDLATKEADRQALIARLRDAHINSQLKSDMLMELQTAMINQLADLRVANRREADVNLNQHVAEWLPDTEQESTEQKSSDT